MLKFQNWKTKLVYIGFGSLFGCLCAIIGMLASPVTAQNDKFDTIQCSRLEIVDAVGQKDVVLGSGEHGGYVHVYGKGEDSKTAVLLLINERGAHIAVTSRYATSSVILGATQNGYVNLYGENGKDGKPAVELGINEAGNGVVNVSDKDGTTAAGLLVLKHGGAVSVADKDGTPAAILGVDEHGAGVRVMSKDQVSSSNLGVNEHGGIVGVYGKGEGAAAMGINEYGNGVINTWDKNGYPQQKIALHNNQEASMKRDELSRRAWREEGNFKAHPTMATTIKTKTFLQQEYALEIGGISMLAQVFKFGRVWKLRVTEGAWPYVSKMGSKKPVIELNGNTLVELAAKLNEDIPWEKWLASIITPDAKSQ